MHLKLMLKLLPGTTALLKTSEYHLTLIGVSERCRCNSKLFFKPYKRTADFATYALAFLIADCKYTSYAIPLIHWLIVHFSTSIISYTPVKLTNAHQPVGQETAMPNKI